MGYGRYGKASSTDRNRKALKSIIKRKYLCIILDITSYIYLLGGAFDE